MIGPIDTAASGIAAAQKKLDVAAHNIANMNTDEFKKGRVAQEESVNGGVATNVGRVSERGHVRQTPEGDEVEGSNVNLAEEMVTLLKAEHSLEANINALETADEMERSLLDIFV
jgi:flagellar basal-body rod protein FlgC